jgi:signal transduction histidine kinase
VTALPIALVSYITTTNLANRFQRRNRDRITYVRDHAIKTLRDQGAYAGSKINKAIRAPALNDIGIQINEASDQPNQPLMEIIRPEYITDSAKRIADSLELDVFTILYEDGTIISAAHWPERFGYKNPTLVKIAETYEGKPFLIREETAAEQFITIQVVRQLRFDYGPRRLIIAGGFRLLNPGFVDQVRGEGDSPVLFVDAAQRTWTPLIPHARSEIFIKDQKLNGLAEQLINSQKNLLFNPELTNRDLDLQSQVRFEKHYYEFTGIPLLSIENKPLGAVLIGLSEDDFYRFLRSMNVLSTWVAGIGAISAILLSILFSVKVTGPVKQLSTAVRSMAMGDLDQRIPVASHDELGMLSAAFNKMALDLKSHREKLIQTERVAAWREMARRLAHELKNPLFPIQVSVETMVKAERMQTDEFGRIFSECTTTILEEINSLKRIINEFSEFARMPKPVFVPLSLNQVTKQVLSLFSNQVNNFELKLDLDPDLPAIQGDKDQLSRLIKNLVANAIEAMPSGGCLSISTKPGVMQHTVREEPTDRLKSERMDSEFMPLAPATDSRATVEEQSVVMRISDTGVGMSEEAKQRLFTPYYTTKPKGTGLGLAIVQSIVADHNGKISVESAVDRGTTFEIELPVNQPV